MTALTNNLTLAPDDAIDLQLHTVYSDGRWQPEDLLDHLLNEQFSLAAITDHDRVDIASSLQQLAAAKQMPLLVATEMTTSWNGGITDILCYGYDPQNCEPLHDLATAVLHAQQENTRQVYEHLLRKGYLDEDQDAGEMAAILGMPAARQPHAVVEFLQRQGRESLGKVLGEAGLDLKTNDTAAVVDAAHRSGAVCIIAHPGRTDGFCCFDEALLDQLRRSVPIDGLEVYYPVHSAEQVALFQEYCQRHGLLVSSGSDSHGPEKLPIKYRAELSRALLERLGVEVK